LKELTILWKDP
jgi:hypothetical protein